MLSKGNGNLPHLVVSGYDPHLPSSMTRFVTVSEAHLWEVNHFIHYVVLDSYVCVGVTSVQFSHQLPPEIKMAITNNRESGGPESLADCLVPKLVCTSHRLISNMCSSLSCWKYPAISWLKRNYCLYNYLNWQCRGGERECVHLFGTLLQCLMV